MANIKGTPKNLKPFKPGQTGNPGGRTPMTPEERVVKILTKKELMEMGSLLVKGDWSAIKEIDRNEGQPALKKLLARCLVKAHEKGDYPTVDKILERIIGKVTDHVNITTPTKTVEKLDGTKVIYGSGKDGE